MTSDPSGGRPKNQGPDGPNNVKPLKIDLPSEEAVKRFMRAPPMPKDGKQQQRPGRGGTDGG
jgi:hypothetical protein